MLQDDGENLALLSHWVLGISCCGLSQNPTAALPWDCSPAHTQLWNRTTETRLPAEKILNSEQEFSHP